MLMRIFASVVIQDTSLIAGKSARPAQSNTVEIARIRSLRRSADGARVGTLSAARACVSSALLRTVYLVRTTRTLRYALHAERAII